MKRKFLVLTSFGLLFAAAACGKKVDDVGPQFSVMSNGLDAKSTSAENYVIKRDDLRSGPEYEVSVKDLSNVEYFDKQLNCGPKAFKARRALRSDAAFERFHISQEEFEGLGVLPQKVKCTLTMVATNKTGSTLTTNIPINLTFDRQPTLDAECTSPVPGITPLATEAMVLTATGNRLIIDQYTLKNTLDYDVGFDYSPNRILKGGFIKRIMAYGNDGMFMRANPIQEFSAEKVKFQPADLPRTGSFNDGYRFRLAPGKEVTLTAYIDLPATVMKGAPASSIFPAVTEPLAFQIDAIKEAHPSLVQWQGFEPQVTDETLATPVVCKAHPRNIGLPLRDGLLPE